MRWTQLDVNDEGRVYWTRGDTRGGRRYTLIERDGCWRAFEHEGIGESYRKRLILEGHTNEDTIRQRQDMVEAWERVHLEAAEVEDVGVGTDRS
jgi:hypothetical protein